MTISHRAWFRGQERIGAVRQAVSVFRATLVKIGVGVDRRRPNPSCVSPYAERCQVWVLGDRTPSSFPKGVEELPARPNPSIRFARRRSLRANCMQNACGTDTFTPRPRR